MKSSEFPKFVFSKDFAHLLGFFSADGSFYKDGRCTRFEFVDGTSVIQELKYSEEFISKIKFYLEQLLNKELPKLRKRNNKYVLQFRSIHLDVLFRKLGYFPGSKTFIIDIPEFYVGTRFEKYFWSGFMDGDGMVARDNKKISLESVSYKLIKSFRLFLNKNKIFYKYRIRKTILANTVYGVYINTLVLRKFIDLIPFEHPRKKLWVNNHLLKKDFYVHNSIKYKKYLINNNVINYFEIFNKGDVFVVNGCNLINNVSKRKNIELFNLKEKLYALGYANLEIISKLKYFRFKAGKGSTNSVQKPFVFEDKLKLILKYVRVVDGGLRISKQYIDANGENPEKIIFIISKMFDIEPHITSKGECIFSSVVLNKLFRAFIIREMY